MKKIGFIPLRKNSKGIRGKNKKKLLGRPLFCWVLTEAIFSNLDRIYVYTDDEDIFNFIEIQFSWSSKVEVMNRSIESATDEASTEQAIFEFCEKIDYNFEIFCLLQATSPFTSRIHINEALNQIDKGRDTVLSVVRAYRFYWDENGSPINYKPEQRPRRQDFKGNLVENGALYMSKKQALKSSKTRISGKIGFIEMPEYSYTEIDSETDWSIAEKLIFRNLQSLRSAAKITHLFLDVDGVFTDGRVLFSESGELAKVFDMRDGMGLEILRQQDVEVAVMTSEDSALVSKRMEKLKIGETYLGVKDKYAFLHKIILDKKISFSQIAYIGDDINDMACMSAVGWAIAPKNAMAEIKEIADLNLSSDSGSGAIREACNFIIKYNKRFE
ncbi:N-acylneuraminate cytidylyltransferase [Salegentibacter sp. 24]|uniref:acylneuraminate cytidylyltransferase n=1 Tax=Salegentibacter sp. 24 TaxID=2183986 RepID=UPI00105E2096|nr:acylneuraminate cytidylyltransferase [Salegentibacter sp. 24]TDN89166.1 N-acylneuraminate cytidylyltransferase [Salegentibacter sp. 24]